MSKTVNAKPGVLRNLQIKRVALVEAGANFDRRTGDGAHIMLYKSALPEAEKEKSVKKSWKDVLKGIISLSKETDEVARAAQIEQLTKDADNIPEPGTAPSTPDPVSTMKAHHEQLAKEIADYGAGPHPDGHPVHAMKSIHEQIGKMLESCAGDQTMKTANQEVEVSKETVELQKTVDLLKADLEKERNMRLDREMTELLKSFKATSFSLETDVAKFRKMKENDPEGFTAMMDVLKKQDAMLVESQLFQNVGTPRHGAAGSSWNQLEELAKTRRAELSKSGEKLSFEQSMEQVMEENPELVRKYRAEAQ